MSEGSRKVANFILENPHLVASMSIGELAKATQSAKSLIVRVAKRSGYLGYRGLRAALTEHVGLLRGANLIGVDLSSDLDEPVNFLKLSREVVKINLEAVRDTLRIIDEGLLLRTVNALLRAKRVLLAGFGTPLLKEDGNLSVLIMGVESQRDGRQ
jgi:DNA-binding MurR/RpiR family transcriptional regulator